MKFIIVSDIHGNLNNTLKLLQEYKKLKADKLILLGDILYHGPRNPLPESYNTQAVFELLKKYKDKIIWIKGNCDSEVDEMVLEIKSLKEKKLKHAGYQLYLSHGHHFDPYNYEPLFKQIFLFGHYHLPLLEKTKDGIKANPGSIGLPKNNLKASFIYLDEKKIVLKD
ncbi:MAG: phosphodiesterase, partial [Bacillales bacterium]|nr:phosphodiesterase [Bacillales bacterium]